VFCDAHSVLRSRLVAVRRSLWVLGWEFQMLVLVLLTAVLCKEWQQ